MQSGETLPLSPEGLEDEADLAKTAPTQAGSASAPAPDMGETMRVAPAKPDEDSSSSEGGHMEAIASPASPLPPGGAAQKIRRFPSFRRVAIFGLLGLAVIAMLSAFAGYNSGIRQRKQAEALLVSQRVQEQFELGMQDMQAKNYDLARQRFEYVISLDPNYPGVTEALAEVLVQLNAVATPTLVLSPTPSPTPDLRGVEELFTQAQEHLANFEWGAAIDTLLALRKADPTYQPVWVDDMLYVAYRNRGKDKILKSCDLEGGIYDIAQARQFGPLDADANNYMIWANLYLTGASFWDLDWSQAVYYFAQIAPALPNMCDGSGMTATERYRQALIGYGDFLSGKGDYCAAKDQYEAALNIAKDTTVEEAFKNASDVCRAESEQPAQQETQPSATAPSTTTEAPPTQPSPAETPTEPPPPEPSPTPGG